jgi:hypothetical protein
MTKVVTSMSKFFKYFKKTNNIKMSVVLKWILKWSFFERVSRRCILDISKDEEFFDRSLVGEL